MKHPWPDDYDDALDAQAATRRKPKPSLRSQLITGLKIFLIGGAVLLALVLADNG